MHYLSKIAIVGAGGNSGKYMTRSLLSTGKHIVTAITRLDSDSYKDFPEGVNIRRVNYDEPSTLVEALKGQEALVITLSGRSPYHEIEEKLVRAAAEANVPWILPNEWSPDSAHEGILEDVPIFQKKVATRELIRSLGKSSYVSVCTGFWYEWMMPNTLAFGFDFAKNTVTFFDDGETPVSLSSWPQVGRAVAGILSLSVDELDALRNKVVYVNSFTITQREMLNSAQRVSSTTSEDWTITKESSQQRYNDGLEQFNKGDFVGMMKMMSTRIFFLDGCGDFEHNKGTLNQKIGLHLEDLDQYTAEAYERSKKPLW